MPFQETITIINNSGKIISTVSPVIRASDPDNAYDELTDPCISV
jgi:hypothetical protein